MYVINTVNVQQTYGECIMIISIGGIKGGTGKTTLATNLAVLRSATGKKVLLVDADEQKSSTIWANQRYATGFETKWDNIQLFGKAVFTEIPILKPNYDDIIIDVGGRETRSLRAAVAVADIFLMPFRPRSPDIWTGDDLKLLIQEMLPGNPKLQSYAIVNQAESKGTDNDDSIEILKEFKEFTCLDFTIGARKSFGNAMSDGVGVNELKNQDKKAIQEIQALYDFLYSSCTCSVQ